MRVLALLGSWVCLHALGQAQPCPAMLHGVVLEEDDSFSAAAVGDLNGDGLWDLIAADSARHRVVAYLGRPEGALERVSSHPAYFPRALALADYNADGKQDVAVSHNDNISVFAGNGDGTLGAQIDYPHGGAAIQLSAGDLQGDGTTDLVAFYRGTPSEAWVLVGDGAGAFTPATSIWIDQRVDDALLLDVTGDAFLDIVACIDQAVALLPGLGDGTFGVRTDIAVGMSPVQMAAGDFDGDADVDVATANLDSHDITILLQGAGTLALAAQIPVNGNPEDLVAGDLDGSGNDDLVLAASLSGDFKTIQEPASASPIVTSYGAWPGQLCLALADWNADGAIDLAFENTPAAALYVARGDGKGRFAMPTSLGTDPAEGLAVDDVNGDAIPDILVSQPTADRLAVFLGTGQGGFGPPIFHSTVSDAVAMASGDVDGDGLSDLVLSSNWFDDLYVRLATGWGGFSAESVVAVPADPQGLALADVSGDGVLDVVVACRTASVVAVLEGNGDGTFGPPAAYGVGLHPAHVCVAQLNGDARPDIVVGNEDDGTVSVLRGTGGGRFGPPLTVAVPLGVHSVAVADLDVDGDVDIVVASDGGVSTLLRNGKAWAFQPGPSVPMQWIGDDLAVADVNGDALPDVVVTGDVSGRVAVALNAGLGQLTLHRQYWAPSADQIQIRDLDGRGAPEIVVAGEPVLVFDVVGSMFKPPSLREGAFATPYAVQLGLVDAPIPVTFTLTGGALPLGMMLSASGLLHGTPLESGTFTLDLDASDAAGCRAGWQYELKIRKHIVER